MTSYHYPGYGTPVHSKRRRKLRAGYTYNGLNQVISPHGQLVFARREGRQTVWVEGCNVQLYNAMRKLRGIAVAIKRTLGRI